MYDTNHCSLWYFIGHLTHVRIICLRRKSPCVVFDLLHFPDEADMIYFDQKPLNKKYFSK